MTHDIRKFMNVLNEQFTPDEMNRGIGYETEERPAEEPKDKPESGEEEVEEGFLGDKFRDAVDDTKMKYGNKGARDRATYAKNARNWTHEFEQLCQARDIDTTAETLKVFLKKKKGLSKDEIEEIFSGFSSDSDTSNDKEKLKTDPKTNPDADQYGRIEPTIGSPGGAKPKSNNPANNPANNNAASRKNAVEQIKQLKQNIEKLTKQLNGPGTPEEKAKIQAKIDAAKNSIKKAQSKQVNKTVNKNDNRINIQDEMGDYLVKTRNEIKNLLASGETLAAHKLENELVDRAKDIAGNDGVEQLKNILRNMKKGNISECFIRIEQLFSKLLVEKQILNDVKSFLAENYIVEGLDSKTINKLMLKAVTYHDLPDDKLGKDSKSNPAVDKDRNIKSGSVNWENLERELSRIGIKKIEDVNKVKKLIQQTKSLPPEKVKSEFNTLYGEKNAEIIMAAIIKGTVA
jgi:hypothetical protein